MPFVYDSETGYYELNSDRYGVYFADGVNADRSGSTMTIADRPVAHKYDSTNYQYATGFFPFNSVTGTTSQAKYSTSTDAARAYQIDGNPVFGFGMVTSVNFKMTETGTIKDANDVDQDITFEFSGDDDVWVYVDGKLALDIGGTHDAIHGTINFRTGSVTLDAPAYGKISDLAKNNPQGTTLSQTNLYTALGTDLSEFAGNGLHTLTIYYMERGRGRSNCQIKFNLPQSDTVSVTKQAADTKLSDTGSEIALSEEEKTALNEKDFSFVLFKNNAAVANAVYTKMNANGVSEGKYTTAADGKFTLKAGQTAVFDVSLDGARTYYVQEENPATEDAYYASPAWTYTSNIAGAQTSSASSSEWVSNTYSVTGSRETADTIGFTCTNQLGYKPNMKAALVDDVVVIDYNHPVEVNVFANDEFIGKIQNIGLGEGNHGTAEFTGAANTTENNNVKYTLKDVLSEVDEISYSVTAVDPQDPSAAVTGEAKLSVVPASNVYYEDDFATNESDGTVGITYSGNWTPVETEGASVTESQSNENVIYGTDEAYADDLGYTNGSAQKGANGAKATFKFKGTGVDIYSSADSDACYTLVKLYKGTGDNKKQISYALVNNYADQGTYYAVPTVTFTDLDYDDYEVQLTVVKNNDHAETINYYLDGIRVYNPLGTVSETGTVAGDAYAAASALNAVYTELRSLLLEDSAQAQPIGTNGILFVDQTSDETLTGATYVNDGPKHEVYLAKGEGIAFQLSGFGEGDAVYVGIKSAHDVAGSVSFTNGTGEDGQMRKTEPISVASSADQYYRITPDAEGNVVITNTGDALLALTKVRTTSADGNTIDFVTSDTAVLSAYVNASESGYYTLPEEKPAETVDAGDDQNNGNSGEVVIENPDVNKDDTSSDQSAFRQILDLFFGWIRGRR